METVVIFGTVLAIAFVIAVGKGMVMVLRERMAIDDRVDAVTR